MPRLPVNDREKLGKTKIHAVNSIRLLLFITYAFIQKQHLQNITPVADEKRFQKYMKTTYRDLLQTKMETGNRDHI